MVVTSIYAFVARLIVHAVVFFILLQQRRQVRVGRSSRKLKGNNSSKSPRDGKVQSVMTAGEKSAKVASVSKKKNAAVPEAAGEKSAKVASISKKKNAAVPEAVDWAVEDFAKDLQYFHDVVGLPNEGKIPKDITAEDVPLAEVEKHFGVKAKNDKNGYKKEGVKGIPAEDIHKLVIALDGIEKFQLYSLEIARGLYYERILKRPVNWAACGADKHKGQLSWRLSRKAPVQLEVPPWKRVEHKYTMPPGLKLNFLAEEEELYGLKSPEKRLEAPIEGRMASDVKVESNLTNGKPALPGEVRKADDVVAESNLKNDQAASSGEWKKADNSDSIFKQTSDHLSVGKGFEDTGESEESPMVQDFAAPEETPMLDKPGPKIESDREESAALEETPMLDKPTPKLGSDREESADREETPMLDKPAPKIGSDREESADREETPMPDKAAPKIESDKEESAAPEEPPMSDNPAPKPESSNELSTKRLFESKDLLIKSWLDMAKGNVNSPMLAHAAPKPESSNKLIITPAPERKDLLLESWLDIVKGNLEALCPQVEKSDLDITELTSRMEKNNGLLNNVEKELRELESTQGTCKGEVGRLRKDLEAKVAEKNQIQSDIAGRGNDDPLEGNDQGMNEAHHAEFLRCCSEANAMQEAIESERRKHSLAMNRAQSKLTELSKFDDADNIMKDEMRLLKQTAARLTQSRDALRAEWSRLQQLLGKGSVHARAVSMVCPLELEESHFPITECPICSLGFFCNNWVPTPCGHCYHPNCLFSLLQIDESRAPKCEACSEVFHPAWLACWGLPQVNHPEVVKLADDWRLAEQANSFVESLLDLYSKNASKIEPRRKAQAAKHKKVTKLYSRESIKKSTQYHETVGKAALINLRVMRAESKENQRVGPLEAEGPKRGLLSVGTEGGENSPQETAETGDDLQTVRALKGKVDLSIVKIEKGAPELGSIASSGVQCVSSDSEKVVNETATKSSSKKRKDVGTTAAPSPAKLKLRAGTLAQIQPPKVRAVRRPAAKK